MTDEWIERLFNAGPAPEPEDTHIEAVPTPYGGITFRSALEARWARTLTEHGVVWEYEPEMITLPSGTNYLPDFRLPEIGAWLEVKGDNIPRVEKARELGLTLACDCSPVFTCTCRWRGGWIVIIGHPPRIRPRGGSYELRPEWWLNWSPAYGGTPWFANCSECSVRGWTTSPACRACQKPITSDLIAAADERLRMAR